MMHSSGSAAYFDFDALGSTVGLTDSGGSYINEYAYAPFGGMLKSIENVPNPFEFIGREGVMNDDNGLSFMRARYYAPDLGRFLAQDPIRLDSQDANLYRYAGNNPVDYSDPSGLTRREKHPGSWPKGAWMCSTPGRPPG